ncbi:MAG: hypothetical protein ACD_19C00426G0134 [uncultured bacterium]|nr:MAG: hypothetical protein ACD_19C00426G0134 [uncultured bacterium]
MNTEIVKSKDPKLSLKQKLFCQAYVDGYGNGTEAVLKAGYSISNKNGHPDRNLAKSIASENLTKPYISAYIASLLEKVGFNDENVAAQHLFLINQCVDLGVKVKAIDMYYKLKGKYAESNNNNSEANEVLDQVILHIRKILPE